MPLASSFLPRFPIPMIAGLAVLVSALVGTPARGAVALSKVIVDLDPEAPPRDDIEITNTGDERQYIVAEPAVIQAPGTAQEKRIDSSDPTVTGLLVSPQKLVLEPHESKLIRVALVAPRGQQERVYRLTIKPVAGTIEAEQTSLKVFVGYDVLVIARPVTIAGEITAKRSAGTITFHNGSNASVELADGRQCDASGNNCATLPGMRLYSGADVSVPIRYSTPVRYSIRQGKVLIMKDY
jgi:P pilus assembly chaperone PapD